MPRLNLNVSKHLLEDLREISAVEPAKLDRLADSLDGENNCIISPSKLRDKISASLNVELSTIVERVAMGLATVRRRSNVDTKDIVEELARAVDQSDWDDATRKQWRNIQPALERLLDKPSVNATAKAVDLLYDYDAFFAAGNILTDIRPVFDDQHGSIVGAAVNYTLRLAYSDGAGKQTDLSLILDLDDIEKLKKACDDALRKGSVIINDLRTKWKITPLTIDEIKNDRG